jgi:hypothetical protein
MTTAGWWIGYVVQTAVNGGSELLIFVRQGVTAMTQELGRPRDWTPEPGLVQTGLSVLPAMGLEHPPSLTLCAGRREYLVINTSDPEVETCLDSRSQCR